MRKLMMLFAALYLLISGFSVNAQVTESEIAPVYNGDNGLLNKVLRPKCLGCHSSERTGVSRNDAPEGLDFDTYEGASQSRNDIVKFAVDRMTMPPIQSLALSDAEKRALENWRLLGAPEDTMPAHYVGATGTLELPETYIFDADGNVTSKFTVEMKLIEPVTEPFRFEIHQLNALELEANNN